MTEKPPVPSVEDVIRALARQSHFGGDAAAAETVRTWTDQYDADHAPDDPDSDDSTTTGDKPAPVKAAPLGTKK